MLAGAGCCLLSVGACGTKCGEFKLLMGRGYKSINTHGDPCLRPCRCGTAALTFVLRAPIHRETREADQRPEPLNQCVIQRSVVLALARVVVDCNSRANHDGQLAILIFKYLISNF